ncbi:choline/ethanolamine kinase [Nematocida sp. AWRm77]|nr:choline/ethanolamine kinase [Nematocida sp. AWRm77]
MKTEAKKLVVQRGKARNAIKRVAAMLGCAENELRAEKKVLGYTNSVFTVYRGSDKYIYKEYAYPEENISAEIEWQRFFQAPKVLLESPLYRIDEYIEHMPQTKQNIKRKGTLKEIAKALAKMHSATPPSHLAVAYLTVLARKREHLEKRIKHKRFSAIFRGIEKHVVSLYSSSVLPSTCFPCHNDLQLGNILVCLDGRVMLIDFEHVSLNLPTAEIATFFTELASDYSKKNGALGAFPLSESTTLSFIEEYLAHTKLKISPSVFLEEVEKMKAVAWYYEVLWSIPFILDINTTKQGFHYFAYMVSRLGYLCDRNYLTPTNVKEIKKILAHAI